MAESPLEELEILRSFSHDLDFSRLAVKRLAIDVSMLSSIPTMVNLEELVITNLQPTTVALNLERFPQVARLTLSGEYHSISRIDTSILSHLKDFIIEVTSYSKEERQSRDNLATNSVAAMQATSLVYSLDNTWTNATFEAALCSAYNSTVTSLRVDVGSIELWFRFPSCISSWAITSLTCSQCQMPNFTLIPPSITDLGIENVVGTWTQAEAGTNFDEFADFFDWSWLPSLPNLETLYLGNNHINGTLPNHLSHPKITDFAVAYNKFVGTISPDWFVQYPSLGLLVADDNLLSGTIPYYGLEKLVYISMNTNEFTHWPTFVVNATYPRPTQTYLISFVGNSLVEIPSEADFQAMKLQFFYIDRNPYLVVPFPNIFNTTIPRSSSTMVNTITAADSGFTGSLPTIPEYQLEYYKTAPVSYKPLLYFNNNDFSGTVPWVSLSSKNIGLYGNDRLGGALATIDPSGTFIASQFVSEALSIRIEGDGFTGPMFNISLLSLLEQLNMHTPNMDFCAIARTIPLAKRTVLFRSSSLTSCSLTNTNANRCAWAYPSVCELDPIDPSELIEPCPLPAPGAFFACEGNTWVSKTSVTQQIFSVPASSTTVINGNLTTTSVSITSASATINVTGCVSTPDGTAPTVTVVLTQHDLEEIVRNGKTLTSQFILQGASCPEIPASALIIDTKSVKSCKTIKTDKIQSTNGLAATFTVNTSKCNLWWIILVSVLCGLAFVAVIVTVIVYKLLLTNRRKTELRSLTH